MRPFHAAGLVVLTLLLAASPAAEQLAVRIYTTADGLPRNIVHRIVQDRRGFVWLCTSEGLAQFDGYGFTTYGRREGLPDADVTDLLITRAGEYFIATRRGLCAFDPDARRQGRPRFTVYTPGPRLEEQQVISLFQDREDGLWCATSERVYRLRQQGRELQFDPVALPLPASFPRVVVFNVDSRGTLWVGTKHGVFRRDRAGMLDHLTLGDGLPSNTVTTLLEDREGRLWLGTDRGLCFLRRGDGHQGRTIVCPAGLKDAIVHHALQAADGSLWVATEEGLARVEGRDESSMRLVTFTVGHGLPPTAAATLAEDGEGNLWVGSSGGGAARFSPRGFVTYGQADGLPGAHITSIFESRSGRLCVTRAAAEIAIHCYDGQGFSPVVPRLPRGTAFTWGWNQVVLQDHLNDWWVSSDRGIWRVKGSATTAGFDASGAADHIDLVDGLPSNETFRLFEDSRGDIWIATLGQAASGDSTTLARWDRRSRQVVQYPGTYGTATAFREDRAGNLWIGRYTGGVVRYRAGRFETFGAVCPRAWCPTCTSIGRAGYGLPRSEAASHASTTRRRQSPRLPC